MHRLMLANLRQVRSIRDLHLMLVRSSRPAIATPSNLDLTALKKGVVMETHAAKQDAVNIFAQQKAHSNAFSMKPIFVVAVKNSTTAQVNREILAVRTVVER